MELKQKIKLVVKISQRFTFSLGLVLKITKKQMIPDIKGTDSRINNQTYWE